jgi:hypothetical protein
LRIAERDPRRGAQVALRWADHDSSPWMRYTLGLILLRWERIDQAVPHLHAAATALGALAPQLQIAQLLARQLAGEGASLQPAWIDLMTRFHHEQRWAHVACAVNEQAAHLTLLGRYQEASALLEEHGDLVQRHGAPADHARYQHVQGIVLAGLGAHNVAEAALAAARQQFVVLHRPVDAARVQFEQAWLAQRREEYAAAEALLAHAQAVFQRVDLPFRVALCQKDRANCAYANGDFAAALALIAAARTTAQTVQRPVLVAYCEHILGTIAHTTGLFDLALVAYGCAEACYLERGMRRLQLICGRNRALVMIAQTQPAAALALLNANLTALEALGDALETAEHVAARAKAHHGAGQHAAAQIDLVAAETAFRALHNLAAAAECQLDAGWIALVQGDLAHAEQQFCAAQPAFAQRPQHRWRVAYGLARVAELRGDLADALAHYAAAGATIAGLRRLASEHAASSIFTQAQEMYRAAINLAARGGATAHLAALAEQQRGWFVQQRTLQPFAELPAVSTYCAARREALADAVARADAPAITAALNAYIAVLLETRHQNPPPVAPLPPFDLHALRQHMHAAYGTNWTLLAPLLVDAALHLVLISPTTLTHTTQPYDAELHDLLRRSRTPHLRGEIFRDLAWLRGATPRPWHTLQRLAERLIPPQLHAQLHPEHHLVIVPTGPLFALPWAALRVNDHWLAQQAIIHYQPTIMPQARPPLDRTRPACLIGCSQFAGRAADLPSASACLDVAHQHWVGPITRLEDTQATRMALLAADRQGVLHTSGLIQIASHAVANDVSGLLAHIFLHESKLWVDDVQQLHLNGSLVVLAACSAAASEVLPGDELLGIGRAFLSAGASGVLASFWPIYDRTVVPFMEAFYQALSQHNDPARALVVAQRHLIASPDPLLAQPAIWASFGYTGIGVATGETVPTA